jgi:hypothetical protein
VRLGALIGWAAIAVVMSLAFVPRRRILLAPSLVMVAVAAFLGVQLVRLATPGPTSVPLDSPVRGTWSVASGGRSALLNHHYLLPQQRHALDLTMVPGDGRPPRDLRDHPAYGQPLYAPADGTVTTAEETFPDLPIGASDPARPQGNHVVIDIGAGRYVLMAHLQHASVAVTVGQHVRAGDPVARVGTPATPAHRTCICRCRTGQR